MKEKGFTLIELLVVMTIIAVLAGLALVSYQGVRKTARDGKRKTDLEQIRSALEMCYADTNGYPGSIYDDVSCIVDSTPRTYLNGTPKDPVTSVGYYYFSDGTTYALCAALEAGGGSVTTCTGGNDCGTGISCNYEVTNP